MAVTQAIDKDGGYRLVVSSNGQGHCTIATKYNRNLYTEDTKVSFEAGTLSPQTWHHLLCVYDGAALQVYVDGKPVGTFAGTNLSGSIQTSSKTITIGGVLQKNWFRGRIDEVKIWNIWHLDALSFGWNRRHANLPT